jgi:hypothetical protein
MCDDGIHDDRYNDLGLFESLALDATCSRKTLSGIEKISR